MSRANFFSYIDDFVGHRVYSATPGSNIGHDWLIIDTSAAGAPTHAPVTPSSSGEVKLTLEATSEVQNLCLAHADILGFDIDKIVEAKFRVKMGQAALTTGSQFAFGLTGARNDAIDSVAQAALFRVIGADSTTLVVVESDDGTTDLDDKATGQTLINAYKDVDFCISFALGTADVRFFINGQPVATNVTFNMSAYTGGLQPFFQLQKAANTNVDSVIIDRVEIRGRR